MSTTISEADVSEEDVPQPINVHPLLVGLVLDHVRVVPCHLVCDDGAPLPPFGL